MSSPWELRSRPAGHHGSSTTGEIGAATGIEFLPGGGVLAAAEPVRRGGGSAMTELPETNRDDNQSRAAGSTAPGLPYPMSKWRFEDRSPGPVLRKRRQSERR